MQHLRKLVQVWERGQAIILDTETTGTGFLSQIVSIAGVYRDGGVAFNSLIRPTLLIPKEATVVHGITNEAVAQAPRWPQFVPELIEALRGREVISYNAEFEVQMLKQSFLAYDMLDTYREMVDVLARPYATCAMQAYAEFWGEWSIYHHKYRWQSLSEACHQQAVQVSEAHDALADCRMTRLLIEHIVPLAKQKLDRETAR